jgi:hypothetical protein
MAAREHRLDDAPLVVAEFIPHHSTPQFGSLIRRERDAINDDPAFPELPSPDMTRIWQNRRD